MSDEAAQRVYRTWIIDSRRWEAYRPRTDDIVIATYPKCGTTWMQQIVSLLIFQSPEPRPITQIGNWVERRQAPIDEVMAAFEAQQHRRFLKSHLPYDGLPIYDRVRYIHVARDGRDACLSYHNQITRFRPEMKAALDSAGLADESIGRPFPEIPKLPADYFRVWLSEGVGGAQDGSPFLSYFDFEKSWWDARHRSNVLMVHYRDLKAGLEGEMRRVADFLGIRVPEPVWPELVSAAEFESMRRHATKLNPRLAQMFNGGPEDFYHKGENDRWQGILTEADLGRYDRIASARLPSVCATWLREGRLGPSKALAGELEGNRTAHTPQS